MGRRGSLRRLAILALLLSVASLSLAPGVSSARTSTAAAPSGPHLPVPWSSTPPLTINLTVTPPTGAAPLVVALAANASGGSPPYRYLWDLGDGNISTLQSLAHSYSAVGDYTASVTVEDATSATASGSVAVRVVPPPLVVTLSPLAGGAAPALSAILEANVSGGEAPFLFTWEFGDGMAVVGTSAEITHTYAGRGTYFPTVQVTDRWGTEALGGAKIVVGGGAPSDSACVGIGGPCGPLGVTDPTWAIAGGLVLVVGGASGWTVYRSPRRPRPGPSAPIAGSAPGALPLPPGGTAGSGPTEALAAASPGPSGPPAELGRPSPPPTEAVPSSDPRPLSERILIHLYRQGVPDSTRAVPVAFTQEGLSAALGRPQSAFARALLRLEESGLLRVEISHVQGRARRSKTYRLTPQGESAARRLGAAFDGTRKG